MVNDKFWTSAHSEFRATVATVPNTDLPIFVVVSWSHNVQRRKFRTPKIRKNLQLLLQLSYHTRNGNWQGNSDTG